MVTPLRTRIVALLVIALSLMATGFYWWQISRAEKQLRSETIAQAELRARQLNSAVADEVANLIRYVDFAAQELAASYSPGKSGEFDRLARTIGQRFPEHALIQIAVIDAKGYLAFSSLGMKDKVYLGDREHYKVHLRNKDSQLFISAPVLGRVSRQWSIQFSRSIRHNGRFDGVIVISLSPEYLRKSLADIALAADDSIAIVRQSGEYLARNTGNDQALGQSVTGSRAFLGADVASNGSFRSAAKFDNIVRFYQWQRLRDAPVVVVLGLSEGTLLQPVEAIIAGNRWQAGAATAALWLLTLGAMLLLRRLSVQQKLLVTNAEQLSSASRDLGEREHWLRTIIETEPECIKVVDRQGKLVEMNAAGLAMLEADSLEAVQQKNLIDYVDPEYRDAFMSLHRRVMSGKNGILEFKVTGLKGTSRYLETHATPMRDANGEISLLLGVTRDVTGRKRSELLIKQSEQRFKTLAEGTFEGIVISEQGKVLDCNDQLTRILGFERDEIIGRPVSAFIASEDVSRVMARVTAGQESHLEHGMIRKDGSRISVEGHGQNVEQDGTIIRITSIRDITEQTRLVAELKKEKEKFETLMQMSGDGIHIVDFDGNILDVNDKFCAMLGYTRSEMLTMNVAQWDANFSPEELWRVLERNFRVENVFETRHRRKNGDIIDVEVSAKSVNYDGRTVLWNASRDISERKQAELAIRVNAERLVRAELASRSGNWELHLDTNRIIGSEGARKLYGIDLSQTDYAAARSIPLPEYRAMLDKSMAELIENDRPYDVEFKIRTADTGEIRDIHSVATYDKDKRIVFGIIQDVTERKLAEESLTQARMVYDNSAEAIAITDADNRIVAVNPAFTRTTGYTPAEVIGRNPKILSSGKQDAEFYRRMWQDLNAHGTWQGEIWNRRKNGEVYAEQLSINTIYGEDGRVHRRIALFRDVTEKKKSDETIWRQANFDALTGLPNRRMLHDRLELEIRKAHRSEEQLALLFIDLDRFKEINDSLGHHVGDELLVEAGKRLRSTVRETDTVARLGGDEFTVILTQTKGASDIEQVAQNIIRSLAKPYQLGAEMVFASASVGIAVYPEDSTNPDQLMQYADQAMYGAKEQGRNRFSYFTSTMQGAAQTRLRTITELRRALPEKQFRLHFQPIVELGSGRIVKAEALLRWQHPEHGLVSPMTFIPLAEETGLIIEIGDWVFRESAQWAAKWNVISAGFQISVNKSPVQFRNKEANEGITWPAYLYKLGLTGRNIAVEITEGMLLNQDRSTGKKLLQFRDAGIQVSIDDFGTGYSALSYLKRFDIDYLKIDMSFVRNIANDPADHALCEAIVVMAHKLGLKVIAEGVETDEQRAILMQIGCDFAQGYLFGKPMPGEELDAVLRSRCGA